MKIEKFTAHIEKRINEFEQYCREKYPEMLEDDMNMAEWVEQFTIFLENL